MTRSIWPGAAAVPQLPFRRLFSPLRRPVPEDAEIVTAYTDGTVTLRSNRSKVGYHEAADLSGFQGVAPGDFVVHGLDIMRGSVGIADSAGAISAVCTVCKPSSAVDPRYVAYAIRLQAASGYPKALARGVREGGADFRRWDTLGELPIPAPPVDEQKRICDYLDFETAEIDEFIADQEQLVGLLGERRVATISRAVTRGLDPSARSEETSTSLTGRTPVGWKTGSLRRLIRTIEQGVSPQAEEGLASEVGDVGVLKAGCVNGGVFRETEHKRLPNGYPFSQDIVVRTGDLLVNRASGSTDLLGSAGIVGELQYALILSDKTFRLRTTRECHDRWLYWFLNSTHYRAQIKESVSGAEGLANNLPMSTLRAMRATWPPLGEQLTIADHLNHETSEIDAAIADAREAIALSKERRAALISAAVTGQIDLAGVVGVSA